MESTLRLFVICMDSKRSHQIVNLSYSLSVEKIIFFSAVRFPVLTGSGCRIFSLRQSDSPLRSGQPEDDSINRKGINVDCMSHREHRGRRVRILGMILCALCVLCGKKCVR
jgi:hypothetical protein